MVATRANCPPPPPPPDAPAAPSCGCRSVYRAVLGGWRYIGVRLAPNITAMHGAAPVFARAALLREPTWDRATATFAVVDVVIANIRKDVNRHRHADARR